MCVCAELLDVGYGEKRKKKEKEERLLWPGTSQFEAHASHVRAVWEPTELSLQRAATPHARGWSVRILFSLFRNSVSTFADLRRTPARTEKEPVAFRGGSDVPLERRLASYTIPGANLAHRPWFINKALLAHSRGRLELWRQAGVWASGRPAGPSKRPPSDPPLDSLCRGPALDARPQHGPGRTDPTPCPRGTAGAAYGAVGRAGAHFVSPGVPADLEDAAGASVAVHEAPALQRKAIVTDAASGREPGSPNVGRVPGWPWGGADGLYLGVPDVHALVEGAAGQVLAVRAEGHAVHGLLVLGERVDAHAALHIPEPHRGVERRAVGTRGGAGGGRHRQGAAPGDGRGLATPGASLSPGASPRREGRSSCCGVYVTRHDKRIHVATVKWHSLTLNASPLKRRSRTPNTRALKRRL